MVVLVDRCCSCRGVFVVVVVEVFSLLQLSRCYRCCGSFNCCADLIY